MAFKDLFKKFSGKATPPAAPTPTEARPAAPKAIPYAGRPAAPTPDVTRSAAPIVAKVPAAVVPPAKAPSVSAKESPQDLEKAIEMLQAIEAALHTDDAKPKGPLAMLPCSVALKKLPEALRGPAWSGDAFPEDKITVPRQALMDQLKQGRIVFPLAELATMLPGDWVVTDNPDAEIEFDLEQVVAHVPPEWFLLTTKLSDAMIEASQMHDYFKPKARTPTPAATPEVPAAPAAEPHAPEEIENPVAEPRVPVETTPSPAEEIEEPAVEQPEAIATSTPESIVPETMAPEPEQPPAPVKPHVSVAGIPSPSVPEPVVPPAPPVERESLLTRAIRLAKERMPSPSEPKAPIAPPPVVRAQPQIVPQTPAVSRVVAPAPAARSSGIFATDTEGWNGVETVLGAGAKAIDINRADVEALVALPGVGHTLAVSIIEYRDQNGPFAGIYALAEVPGVGPRLFPRMTGLPMKPRRNRHDILNAMLGLAPDAAPALNAIVQAACTAIGTTGGLLSNSDGIPLAFTPELAAQSAQFGALVPQMFRRSERYLKPLTGDTVHCIALPLAEPPLLLFSGEDIYMALITAPGASVEAHLPKALEIVREIDWLMGCRAVVRKE